MKLCEYAPGDIVQIAWRDPHTALNGTTQLVMLGAIRGAGKGKKRDPELADSAIVELVDPSTMKPYGPGAWQLMDRDYNMFVHPNVEAELIERSRFGAITESGSVDDVEDPLLRRVSGHRSTEGELGGI